MTFDHIDNIKAYTNLPAKLKEGLDILVNEDFEMMPINQYQVDGHNLYYLVQGDNTHPATGMGIMYPDYVNIIYVFQGEARVAVTRVASGTAPDYTSDSGLKKYKLGKGGVVLTPGMFVIIPPGVAYEHEIMVDGPCRCRSVVVKIKVK